MVKHGGSRGKGRRNEVELPPLPLNTSLRPRELRAQALLSELVARTEGTLGLYGPHTPADYTAALADYVDATVRAHYITRLDGRPYSLGDRGRGRSSTRCTCCKTPTLELRQARSHP